MICTGIPWSQAIKTSLGLQMLWHLSIAKQKASSQWKGPDDFHFELILGLPGGTFLVFLEHSWIDTVEVHVSLLNYRFENPSRANNWTRTRPVEYSAKKKKCASNILLFQYWWHLDIACTKTLGKTVWLNTVIFSGMSSSSVVKYLKYT